MIHVLSYGDEKFSGALDRIIRSAKKKGADQVYQYSREDIDPEFLARNNKILSMSRGGGYWLWKPYFINEVITKHAQNGDWVVYSDAGLVYSQNIEKFLYKLEREYPDKLFFMKPLKYSESQFTKRDIFEILECDSEEMAKSKMYAATVIAIKVSVISRDIISKWLELAQDYHLISDESSWKKNYPDFVENRHDQSIISILVKKCKVVQGVDSIFVDVLHLKPNSHPLLIYHHSSQGSLLGISIDVVRRSVKYFLHMKEEIK